MTTGLSASIRRVLKNALLGALKDGSDGGIIRLFQNDFQPGPTATLQNFVSCDFPGFVEVAVLVDWLGYLLPASDDWAVQPDRVIHFYTFTPTEPQTAYGWYVTNHSTTTLLGWGLFDVPFVFSKPEEGIVFTPQLFLPSTVGQSY